MKTLELIARNLCIGHDIKQGCPSASPSHGLYYHCESCLQIYMQRYDEQLRMRVPHEP